VTDNDGAESEVQREVSVSDPAPPSNSAPLVQIGSISCTGMRCEYTNDSRDPDGADTIASYSWILGDGENSNSRNASPDYATAGNYPVTLTVTDDPDASDSAEQQGTVSAPADTAGATRFSVATAHS
jgi:hypothetical protein